MANEANENFTLTTFYKQWGEYQGHIRDSVAPLTAEQLALRAAPNLRSIGENAAHIIGCRAGWFTYVLHEDASDEVKAFADLDEAAPRTGAELAQALDTSWQFVADSIARWNDNDEDMQKTFEDEQDGEIVHLTRAWIVWHVLEHDLHHGGEISLTLGMHGIPATFTS